MRLAQGPIRSELADHPDRLYELLEDPATEVAATRAMLTMRKLVIAELEDAVGVK